MERLPNPPKSFHVESELSIEPRIPTCSNPDCNKRITSEQSFCPGCWSRLSAGTRERLRRCHINRNKAGIILLQRRAVAELKAKAKANADKRHAQSTRRGGSR